MSTLAQTKLTYRDIASRVDPTGSVADIVELLAQVNPILEDAVVLESNMDSAHKTTIRTGIPSPTWRKFNQGVAQSKSVTQQVVDSMGMLEDFAVIDKDLADLGGNTAQQRLVEAAAHIEGMSQKMAETFIYGNGVTEKEAFTGIAARFNTLSTDKTKSGSQIIDAGGSGVDNSSIYIACWDPTVAHLIYPKGKKGGLQRIDDGVVDERDGDGNVYKAYRDHFKWDLGFVLRDWRQFVRVANIDVSDLATAGASSYSGPDLVNLLIKAVNKLKFRNKGKIVIYCNRTVHTALELIAANKTNTHFTSKEIGGVDVLSFRGYPIRLCDAITDAEDRVV